MEDTQDTGHHPHQESLGAKQPLRDLRRDNAARRDTPAPCTEPLPTNSVVTHYLLPYHFERCNKTTYKMTAEEEAKQLDSVTDNHQESELDISKASEALGSLGKTATSTGAPPDSAATVAVKPEDVDLIVAELEVTSDEAAQALREAAAADDADGKDLVSSALRKLVTS